MKEDLINKFSKDKELYDAFRERIENLIEDLLSQSQIEIHQIGSRTKDIESLSNKIIKKDKYTDLREITDLVGIRIITYLESEVDRVDELIRKEFDVDDENSIDKRVLETNQFGYRSLHVVVSFNQSRTKLAEYKRYQGLCCEIQIRSVLQHAWAEIEHDLGYKGKSSIPDSYIRSFNRLAALLESADIEFDRLKKELKNYEESVPALIKSTPEKVTINKASMDSLIMNNPTFKAARDLMVKEFDVEFNEQRDYSDLISRLGFFNVTNIKELQDLIEENQDEYLKFLPVFIGKGISKKLATHLPLYWFQHFLAAKTEDEELIEKYKTFGKSRISGKASKFVDAYKEIKNTDNNG